MFGGKTWDEELYILDLNTHSLNIHHNEKMGFEWDVAVVVEENI